MALEQPGQTLQPTALVHEVWLRHVIPVEGSFEDLATLGQILSGEAFSAQSPSKSISELLADFHRFRSSIYPRGDSRKIAENWHRRCYLVSGTVDHWDSMLFHIDQLEKLQPHSTEVKLLRQRIVEK